MHNIIFCFDSEEYTINHAYNLYLLDLLPNQFQLWYIIKLLYWSGDFDQKATVTRCILYYMAN